MWYGQQIYHHHVYGCICQADNSPRTYTHLNNKQTVWQGHEKQLQIGRSLCLTFELALLVEMSFAPEICTTWYIPEFRSKRSRNIQVSQ